MTDVMMILGDYTFSIATAAYDNFRRTSSYRWPGQQRFGRATALQFTGTDAETISLSGTIYPHYAGGLGQIDAMRREAGKGVPLLLIDGLGYVLGDWAITRIEETRPAHAQSGVPKRIDFTLSISAYGEDTA